MKLRNSQSGQLYTAFNLRNISQFSGDALSISTAKAKHFEISIMNTRTVTQTRLTKSNLQRHEAKTQERPTKSIL